MSKLSTRPPARVSHHKLVLALVPKSYEAKAAQSPPPYTVSYYEYGTDAGTLYDQGVNQGLYMRSGGPGNGIAILDFGQSGYKCTPSCGYGAYTFDPNPPPPQEPFPFHSDHEIEVAAESFADGFYHSVGGGYTLRIAVGLNNQQGTYGQVNYKDGSDFATVVNNVANYVRSAGYSSQVTVSGALDIETNWSSFANVQDWINGWKAVAQHVYYDFGDAAACPTTYPGSGWCNSPDWSARNVWWKAFGAISAYPIPEIEYITANHTQANQWEVLSRNAAAGAYDFTQAIPISGATTNYGFSPAGLTPSQGWQQLYDALNSQPSTAQSLGWSTDFKNGQ